MTQFIAIPPFRWSVSALWVAVAVLVFTTVGISSLASWAVLAVGGVIPPIVFLALWNDGPPPTIAEVLRRTEDRD